MRDFRLKAILLVAVGLLATPWCRSGADDVAADRPTLAALMQQKMSHSEQVLQGLIDADFERIQSSADSLLSKGIQESIRNFPGRADDEAYEHFRLEYVRLSSRLVAASQQENLPGATLYYQTLVQTCIACHQHLRLDQSAMARVD